MRKKIVAGNWKMNTTLQEGVNLAKTVRRLHNNVQDKEVGVILAAPFTHLSELCNALAGSTILVAAQNCASETKGAFTGEVSVDMIKSVGCKAVIIGHSERRAYYHETNALLKKKAELLLKANLTPIFCCGETLAERESGKLFDVIKSQISEAIFEFNHDDFQKIIIAYEPVWAIGTGVTATAAQAQEMHAYIRQLIAEKYGRPVAEEITILYGGSCKGSNAKELFSNPDVDGGLIGGAALDAEDFIKIITSF